MNFHELDNFNLADAVKFHRRLNPRIWGSDEHLLPEVREKLLAIAADFQEFLGVDDLKVQDITISGSNAAYSYTPHSDIDLHLVVEMPDDPVYQELFNAKKYQYNDEHDIRIGGVPVELYVQPADQEHHSQGIYSIKNGEWKQVPQRRKAKVDDSCVQHKAADLDARIHSAVKSHNANAINRLWDHIKQMRQSGLEKNGEFGCENITFKLLRNMGCIGRLKDAKTAIRDRELSLEQSKKPRKRVNYGMRDYWFPGTAYAGQDHPAGTESEQVDEAVGGPKIVVVGDSIAVGIAQAAGLPYEAVVGRNTRQILDAAASNPEVQGADLAIVSAGTNDYAILKGDGKNPNPDATKRNISRIRDVLKAKQYVWILPFHEPARDDVLSAIGNDAYVSLADVATTRDRLHPTNYKAVANAALSKFAKPGIMESVDPDHLKKILHRFYKSCVDKLDLKNPPRLRLETTPDWSRENGSFGQYKPESNTLILATAGRHVLDILRTMAHEMTHRQQDEHEPLPAEAGETGSPWEDQANAMAGRIMRQWAEEQPEMFDGVTLEESAHTHLSVPPVLYHATYRPLLRSIKRGGLGGPGSEKKKWEDSIHGAVYLALDPHVAESYAETSDSVPDDWLDEIVILQISTDGLNPSKFMLDRNVRDNAGDTVEYHGIIPLSNISVLKRNMSEASGYIPTKKQAKDPRFVMALTRDVRPGAVGKEANKLGLETDSQGHPALLTAGLQKMLREFKEQDLFEINMGGKNLRKEAAKTGALAGMEFEMIVPNTQGDDEYNQEPDYDADERASGPRDIRDFFYDGDFNSRRSVDGLIDSMMQDYSEWQSEEFGNRWDSDSEQFIYNYIKENMDDDEVRQMLSLEPEDPVGRQEYLLASDMIATDQLEPWYEDAKNDASDQFFEEDQFEEWLADAGLTHMSDIENRYSGDVSWPHYRTASNDSETSIEDVAEEFSQAVGRPVKASTSYHDYGVERPAPGKNFYVVEPDGSLEPDDSDDAGLEFVSPPLPIDEMMSDLNKVKKWADRMGCYTNKSTGLHINISVPNYDLDRLDFVKLALLMGDEYVLNQFGRASNTYAKSAMGKVRDHVQKRPYEAKYLLDKMKGHMGELASKAIHSGSTDKYTSINTKDGHIEFRSPGGDWLGDNFDKIENTLLRFTVALSAAMDPKAYREEYLKKLYKILAPKDEKDPLAVFAKYAAGELPATALKSFVRQAQADRKAKKSGEAIVNGHRWRVSLKPELGGGVVEVMATDPIDAKKQAIIQQPNWRFVDDDAMTIERLDEPAAGASTTGPHPQGRGRPNDPTGRYAIVRRDDQRNYGNHVGSEAPDYQFRFTLPDDYRPSQMNAVLQAWASRNSVNPNEYMIVDTTQFAAPEQTAAPESGSVRWNIINSRNEIVHSFWNRNVQADANAVAREWFYNNNMANSPEGPFEVVPAAIPGSTLDLQRQRMAADAAANTRRWADYEASQTPTPVAGVQDIEPDVTVGATQWEVYDRSTGNPVFRMYAANQQEAWRKGQEWVANYARMTPDQPIDPADYSVRQSAEPVSESISVLEQRLRRELDALGNQKPTGPETPPEMPDGTIKVDVSDMYDWYKLGQHISDLSSIDKSTLGKGPPSTVFAFGSEELENKYSHLLTNLGLKTHDLDEPGEEDVDESQEITKLNKLDSVLEKCIEMIRRGHETDPEKYGRVAACLIDNDNNHTYAINMPGPNGTRRHAERVAIAKHLKRHGRIGPNAIMVTTLSPCMNHMSERDGESCTDLLLQHGIEKCYAGWEDPTQQPAEDYPYNLQVTNNTDIFNTCKDIAASFLPQTVAESASERKIAQVQYMQGECAVLALTIHKMDPQRFPLGFVYEFFDAVPDMYIEPDEFDELDPAQQQDIQYNHENWTLTHAYVYDVKTKEYIDAEGRHKQLPTIGRDFNATRHNKFPAEVQDLVRVSHYMEWDEAQEKWIVLSGWDALDKAYTHEGKQRAREYAIKYLGIDRPAQDVDEAYDGPQMKFLRPGELSGSYSPQQMQSMGFKQSSNGSWYIPMNMWQRLVSGGQIKEGSENVVDFPIANVRRPNGAIGTQGVTTNQVADVLTHLARLRVSPDMSMRELVDTLKADPQAQERLRQSLKQNPVQVLPLPDGSYHLEDGHHRTFLLNLLGDKTVPAVIQGSRPALPAHLPDHLPGEHDTRLPYQQDIPKPAIRQIVPPMLKERGVDENFADGRHPEDKGDSKRLGVPTKSSVSNLRKYAKSHSGRAAQLAHWMANMKSGKKKAS